QSLTNNIYDESERETPSKHTNHTNDCIHIYVCNNVRGPAIIRLGILPCCAIICNLAIVSVFPTISRSKRGRCFSTHGKEASRVLAGVVDEAAAAAVVLGRLLDFTPLFSLSITCTSCISSVMMRR